MNALLLAFTLSFAFGATAQTCAFLGPSDPSSEDPASNGGSWLADSTGLSNYERLQILVPAGYFSNVPYRITDFAVAQKRGWRTVQYTSLTIRMGHTTQATLASTFAINITSPLQDVLVAHDYVVRYGVGPTWVPMGMQRPFQFLPGQGNLLIDITVRGASLLDQHLDTGMLHGWGASFLRSAIETSLPTQGGSQQGTDLPALRFCVDHAESSLFGVACSGTVNMPPLLGLTGLPVLGGAPTFWLSNAPPNSLAFLAFGFDSAPPYPLDLSNLGAPGCKQYFDIAFPAAVITDPFGIGQHTMTVPMSSGVLGQIVLGQFATMVPGANSLGVLTSNYGRLLLGR